MTSRRTPISETYRPTQYMPLVTTASPPALVVRNRSGDEATALNAAVKEDSCPLRPTLKVYRKGLAIVLEQTIHAKPTVQEVLGTVDHNISRVRGGQGACSSSCFCKEESRGHRIQIAPI
uniref:Uncharacterized protein n=1 Tax=Oryza punctata TaxID=4537 RepID=A0A0E0MII9_ORYPU